MRRRLPERILASIVLGFAALALLGCGDDSHGHDHDHEDGGAGSSVLAFACDQVGSGGSSVMASEERGEQAPLVELDREVYEVTLPEGAAGYVRVEVDHAPVEAEVFFAATDVLAGVFDAEGEEVTAPSAGANELCEDAIPDHYHVELGAEGTYYLQLGPTATDEAWMVLVEESDEDH